MKDSVGWGSGKMSNITFQFRQGLIENSDIKMTAELITSSGQVIGKTELSGFSGSWEKASGIIKGISN